MDSAIDEATLEALSIHAQDGETPAPPAETPAPSPETPPEGETAEEGETPPDAAPPEGEAAEGALPKLTKEQLAELWKGYGPDLLELDEAKQTVEAGAEALAHERAVQAAADPVQTPAFQAMAREYDEVARGLEPALTAVNDGLRRLADGDIDVDAQKLSGQMAGVLQSVTRQRDIALAASDHRPVAQVDGLVNALWGSEAQTAVGKTQDGKPLTLDQAWGRLLQGYEQARGDPRQQGQAGGWFLRQALPLIYNLGLTKGMTEGRKQAEKHQDAAVQQAQAAALNEALAKVGAHHPGQPAGQAAASGYTRERIAQMSDAEYDQHADEVHKILAAALG